MLPAKQRSHTMEMLIEVLLNAGLLHYGRFQVANGQFASYRLALEYLPGHPDLLNALALHAAQQLAQQKRSFDFLLSTPEATPLGVATALTSGFPLLTSSRAGESQYDFHGAFDTYHPVAVISNDLEDHSPQAFSDSARRSGLQPVFYLALVGTPKRRESAALPTKSLLDINTVIGYGKQYVRR